MQHTETAVTAAGGPASVSEHMAVARGTVIDRYVVLDEIGAGGFGVVLKAYDPELGRHIALKLLHVRHLARSSGARQLLLREARAIAKLNHPNVVSVYDVGDDGDRVFIAMELIDGQSLRSWMDNRARPWRDVVPIFVQAGRGLAAAHRAGIVHRDFKPGNVIIGDDGRVRVLDFGLARALSAQTDETQSDAAADDDILSETLSQTRGVAGTPAYMSPEQHMGDTPDARSDMFSFCVSLYEALAGARPFKGQSLRELRANLIDGASQPFPDDVTVPSWLRQLIAKGLATEPADRFASMDELLEQLAADRRRSYLVPAIAIAAVVGATTAALLLGGKKADEQAELCRTGADKVATSWNDAARQRIRTAFASSNLPFADQATSEVISAVDSYAESWTRQYDQACYDTHVIGAQSDAMMDKRVWCLQGQLKQLRAVVDTLATKPDRHLIVRATDVLGRLPPPSECADRIVMSDFVPPAPDQRGEALRLRGMVAAAKAQSWAGRYKRAIAELEQVAPAIHALNFKPLTSEWGLALGFLYKLTSDKKRARAVFLEAADNAAQGHMDFDLAAAQLRYAELALDYKSPKHAKRLLDMAEAAVKRAGSPTKLRALLLTARAKVAEHRGDMASAEKQFRKVVRLVHSDSSVDPRSVLRSEMAVATTLLRGGKYDQAIAQFEHILPAVRHTLGPRHPTTGRIYRQLAVLYARRGHHAKARAANAKALAIFEKAYGPEHPETSNVIEWSANLAQDEGDYATAVRMLHKVIAMRVKALGRNNVLVGAGYGNLANALAGLGKKKKALAAYRTALDVLEKSVGENHPHYADTLTNYGGTLVSVGRTKEGIAALERALKLIDKRNGGADNVDLVWPLLGLCEALGDTGKYNRLIPYAERGVRIAKRANPGILNSLRFALGRGLYFSGRDKKRGRAMMVDAGNKLVALGGVGAKRGKQLLDFVAKNVH